MKIKTSDLIGPALDWTVAKCEGLAPFSDGISWIVTVDKAYRQLPKYSTDWAVAGPIIEREGIDVLKDGERWTSLKTATAHHAHIRTSGPTPLIAAMRCYVASKLGDEIEVPDELGKE